MNREEIIEMLSSQLRLEIDETSDYYSPKDKTYILKLMLEDDCLSTVYFNALT